MMVDFAEKWFGVSNYVFFPLKFFVIRRKSNLNVTLKYSTADLSSERRNNNGII